MNASEYTPGDILRTVKYQGEMVPVIAFMFAEDGDAFIVNGVLGFWDAEEGAVLGNNAEVIALPAFGIQRRLS